MTKREFFRKESNNIVNSNKNICALKVAEYLGVQNESRYLHTINDLVYAARKKFTVRSRESQVRNKTIGSARAKLKQIYASQCCQAGVKVKGFILRVANHVIFVDTEGNTIIDSDPRKRDRRKITHCYIVYS